MDNRDNDLDAEIIRLSESEPDLNAPPSVPFTSIIRLIDAEVVSFSEFHHASQGVATINAHVKAINSKIDSDSRRAAIVIAHTTPPFADLPPLWKLGLDAWGSQAQP